MRQSYKLKVDERYISQGYMWAKILEKNKKKKYKLSVECDGNEVYYDIVDEITVPLQFGSGLYFISLYENTYSNRYTEVGKLSLNVFMRDWRLPFLRPNLYVNYENVEGLEEAAKTVCLNCDTDEKKFNAIRQYIKKHYYYNYVKAVIVGKNALPDIKTTFKKKSGICQDIAALVVAMLRLQGVPALLVIGYANKTYHAWVKVYIDGKPKIYDPIAEISGDKKIKTYTPERWY